VDYVFTDPPFGSNIFYSDMNLFQEAWLGSFTDRSEEAVIAKSTSNGATAQRYEALLTDALVECRRVLKPGAWLSMVFSNARGDVWAIAQRALKASGLELDPTRLSSIDKGQRSVKGLASGREDVVTCDLVMTARKPESWRVDPILSSSSESLFESIGNVMTAESRLGRTTPSRVYLDLVRRYIEHHWDLEPVHFGSVVQALLAMGYSIDPGTGTLSYRHTAAQ
jgi:hypothetical protein